MSNGQSPIMHATPDISSLFKINCAKGGPLILALNNRVLKFSINFLVLS